MTERRVLTTGNFPEMPTIVCLCGSTKFRDAFMRANYQETMAGKIVLSVGFFMHSPETWYSAVSGQTVGCTPEQKIKLDELHKRKIDLADEILVLDIGQYVGQSTMSEINYAVAHNKPVRYLSIEGWAQDQTPFRDKTDDWEKRNPPKKDGEQ